MVRFYAVAAIAAATAKAEDVEWFSTDLDPDPASGTSGASTWHISVSMTNDDIEVTLDSGATWVLLGTKPTAGTHTEFTLRVRDTDTVNFRCPDVGGCTLDYFRIDAERT